MALSKVFDTEAFLTTVGAGRTVSTYRAKRLIFRQGTECDAVFYIQKGRVELTVVSDQGKERVVGILSPGDFIGEGCLAGHPLYLASARASTEATVARVETVILRQAMHEHPELSERFMAFLLLRNSQIEADLVDQLFNSSEKRLARLLVMLAQVGQEAELRTVATPISQEVMAARVGTTRSRINYFMNKFRKLGLIEYNGELKVHSSLLNVIVRE
jgi:CRP/FNR family transcriptional regulator, cyclic AMP receptor protein